MSENILGLNLKSIRKQLRLTQIIFADKLGISNGYVSDLEKGKAKPSESLLRNIEREFRINRNWLLTGEGEKFTKDGGALYNKVGEGAEKDAPLYNTTAGYTGRVADQDQAYDKHGGWKPGDHMKSEEWSLLGKAHDILAAESPYRAALAANINAFHYALGREIDLKSQSDEIKKLEQRIAALEELLGRNPLAVGEI